MRRGGYRKKRHGPRAVLPALPLGAGPELLNVTFVVGDIATAGEHRSFDCPHYDSCLNYAIAAEWGNFTCRGCALSGADRQLALRRESQLRSTSTEVSHGAAGEEAQGPR